MSASAIFQSRLRMVFPIVVALLLTGCVYPGGRVVVAGHKYSRGEISFLNLPGTTREEAIATLGQPLWESQRSRVLLYVWTTSMQWVVALPPGGTEFTADEKRRALLVAYDERGLVTGHEVRTIREATLEEACVNWARNRESHH